MTWPGAPAIYYGDEAGVCGFTDPDNRRTYPWGREDKELIAFHKDIIRLRKSCPELRTGSLKSLGMDYNYLAYGRFKRDSQTIVLINNNDYPLEKSVRVWEAGVPREAVITKVFETTESGYNNEKTEIPVLAGKVTLTLPKFSATVLRHSK